MRAFVRCSAALSIVLAGLAVIAKGDDKDAAAKSAEATRPAVSAAAAPALETEMHQLRDLVESQARQLHIQNEELKEQQQQIHALEQKVESTTGTRANFSAVPGALEIGSNAAHVLTTGAGTAVAGSAVPPRDQADQKMEETGPASIKYKGITITPGGYVAAETVYRTRAVSGGINTPFTGIPYPGNALSKVSENNFTARQS